MLDDYLLADKKNAVYAPQPIFFLEFRLDYKNCRLIPELSEFMRKVENSTNLQLRVRIMAKLLLKGRTDRRLLNTDIMKMI